MATEEVPNSRLFIMCGKGASEEIIKSTFEKYGTIKDCWIVRDRRTNDDKGIAYVTFSKTSQAALAMEEMNGRNLEGQPRPLKIVIANNKRDGSCREPKEEERILRLFVMIPKTFKEDDLRREFSQFGDIDYVNVLRTRGGEKKGFGYVKFFRPYHAARAYEECDKSYKAMFAEPPKSKTARDDEYYGDDNRGSKRSYDDDYYPEHRYPGPAPGPAPGPGPGPGPGHFSRYPEYLPHGPPPMDPRDHVMDMLESYPSCAGNVKLVINGAIGLPQRYLTVLFSLIPGLEYCDYNESTGTGYARYSSSQCATYARDKLDGFEYPIGSQLKVNFVDGSSGEFSGTRAKDNPDVRHKAAMVLEKAGINPHQVLNADSAMERVAYCNIPLPPPKPLKPEDSPLAQRLFIVCQPAAVPEKILRDAFCRFANLIDVYLLAGRNYGYAKFGSKESAMKAIQLLHGQHLAGQRVKVLEAEPPKGDDSGEWAAPKKVRH